MHRLDAEILAALNGAAGPQSPSSNDDDERSFNGKYANSKNKRTVFAVPKNLRRQHALAALVPLAVLAAVLGGRSLAGAGGRGLPGTVRDKRYLANGSVPPALSERLADLSPVASGGDGGGADVPVFWHVLKAGGTAVHDLCQQCFALRVASEVGALNGHGSEKELRLVEVNEGHWNVNVDTTALPGIVRAGRLGLAESGLADVIFTPLLIETAEHIFDPQHKGRMFALFRHPIHRVVSQFYYLRVATHEPTYNPAFKDMTVTQWAFTPYVESNWMVRSLVGKMEAPLTGDDLEAAKEIVRTKCLVGLLERMEESVERFRQFFGFGLGENGERNGNIDQCVKEWLGKKSNKSGHPFPIQEGDDVWIELARKNGADMELYEYAQKLFEEQAALLAGDTKAEIKK